MRSIAEGLVEPDATFARFMDLCLAPSVRDVCPSHVRFGRMMERARVQIEPLRARRARFLPWLGLDVVVANRKLLWLAAALQPVGRFVLPRRVRALTPRRWEPFRRLQRATEAVGGRDSQYRVHDADRGRPARKRITRGRRASGRDPRCACTIEAPEAAPAAPDEVSHIPSA